MGCWNTTCGISGLPIHAGEEVVVFLLTQNRHSFMEDFVYNNTYFDPCLLPFYGKYNDYGDVEECYGEGLPYLINALKLNLFEMELGENECHDIPAKKDKLDVENMFELDHEDRLFITSGGKQLRVVHVQIKRSIFDHILSNYTLETYDRKTYETIPHHFSEVLEDLKKIKLPKKGDSMYDYMDNVDRKHELVFRCLYEELYSPLFPTRIGLQTGNIKIVKEMVKGGFIHRFMSHIRKPWIKQIGNGSQTIDPEPYEILIDAMTKVIAKDKKRWDEDEEDVEEEALTV